MAIPVFRMFRGRRSVRQGGWAAILAVVLSLGCATSSPPPEDRLSPAHLKNGPSMYETGRFGTVPLSSGGLKVDEGAIDRRPAARTAPTRTAERQRGKRKPRARAQRLP
jgi:hypothetical protein